MGIDRALSSNDASLGSCKLLGYYRCRYVAELRVAILLRRLTTSKSVISRYIVSCG